MNSVKFSGVLVVWFCSVTDLEIMVVGRKREKRKTEIVGIHNCRLVK